MEYVYAAMLVHKAGKEITEETIKAVLTAAGASPDEAKIKALCAALKDVNIEEAIKNASVAPTATAPAPAQASGDSPAEEKKDEKNDAEEEKKSEAQAAAGLGALFG